MLMLARHEVAPADGFAPSPFRLTGGRTTVIPRWYQKMVPTRGFAPRSADYRSAALLLSYAGKGQVAEDGGHAPQAVADPIRFQGGPGALVRFIFQNWLPQMGSHHHSRIQNPESCLLDDTAEKVSPAGIAPAASRSATLCSVC